MGLTKVTGDFIETGSITQGHLHSSHGITLDHIGDGSTNTFFTTANARAAISATGSLSYNNSTGVMSFTMPTLNTTNITEGDKLFFTNARVDSRVGSLSTSDLSEGTNLYFTNARAISALTAGTNIAIASNGTISSTDTNTTYSVGDGGLTQNNFTNTLKSKLDGIAAGATNYSLPFTDNSSNWNTAYGWGNHASGGYASGSVFATFGTYGWQITDYDGATADRGRIYYDNGDRAFRFYSEHSGSTGAANIQLYDGSAYSELTKAKIDKLDGIAASATNVTNTNQLTNGAGFITSADGGNATTALTLDDGNNQWNWATGSHAYAANSLRLWDQYGTNGGSGYPLYYGSILHYTGRSGHMDSQLFFGSSGEILYRYNFYGNNNWNNWQTIITSSNYSSYALPLSGGVLTGSLTGTDIYHTNWIRNHSNNNGHYWSNTGWHLYPQDSTYFYMRSGSASAVGLNLYASNATRGYVYANSSNDVGFLNQAGTWRLRVTGGDYTEVLGSKLKLNDTSAYIHGGTITSRQGSRFIDVGYSGSCYIEANRTDSASSTILFGAGSNSTGIWSRVGTTNGGATHSSSPRQFTITMGSTVEFTMATNGVMSGDFNDTSDVLFKKNIENHSYGLAAVNTLKPREFNWKRNTRPQGKQVGFIAQEVEEIIPEVVHGYDGAKSINGTGLISVLTKAIQELSQQVTDLKAEVELLKQ